MHFFVCNISAHMLTDFRLLALWSADLRSKGWVEGGVLGNYCGYLVLYWC